MERTLGTARRAHRPGLLVALAAALLLAGCTASGPSGAGDSADQGGANSAEHAAAGAEYRAGTTSDDAAVGTREVVTTGTATLVAADPFDAAMRIASHTEAAGGRVEAREEQRGIDGEPASAHLTLRLPAETVNATIDAFRSLGDVADVSISKQDVTATGRDLDARIAALQASTTRLTELMAGAANTADLLKVEQELANRQADLDALRAQRADLSDRVAMSTLDVHIVADEDAIAALAPPPTGFRGGLEAGWHALTAAARAAAVAFGAVLPWLVLAGAGLAAWRGVAALVRRRRPAPPVTSAPVTSAPTNPT
ncbi:DUF4349 domain-containing protein [Xylanimonas allomyrinae]|uniref:DUF4349 domain-containing protein n=1 Tax=Xylanimonas allomyrinae TaxID=2509459 RepID=A0A4V0YDV9_9MICO|nr:DUF4349 domain-containing protein [Xylanimonas allomyrinae]QAY62071.1 DUF4349 domain-containing protein [Xylanimonas allomyrinae]